MNKHSDQELSFTSQNVIAKLTLKEDATKAFFALRKIENQTNQNVELNADMLETEICNWLETQLPVSSIDTKSLKSAFEIFFKTGDAKDRKIAQGILPVQGTNGKIILLVKPFSDKFEGIYDISTKYQKHFDIIQSGQTVARVYRPKDGTNGLTVQNTEIPFPPGHPYKIDIGEKIELKYNPNLAFDELIAKENGYIKFTSSRDNLSGSISLETTLKLSNGVNHKTGSVTFVNNVLVNGDVLEGFFINATNNIIINGNTTNANIISKNGNIEVNGVIFDSDISDETFDSFLIGKADNQHTINSNGYLKAKALQNARIFAKSNVEISNSIVRSHIYTAGIIICQKAIYASKVSSACGVEARQFGNEHNIKTIIEFLHPVESGIDFITLENKLQKINEKIDKLELFLGPFKNDPKSTKVLNNTHKDKLKNALVELQNLIKTKDEIVKELSSMKLNTGDIKSSQMNCLEICYPNVIVKAHDSKYYFENIKKSKFSLSFDWETQQFSISDYKPITCEIK